MRGRGGEGGVLKELAPRWSGVTSEHTTSSNSIPSPHPAKATKIRAAQKRNRCVATVDLVEQVQHDEMSGLGTLKCLTEQLVDLTAKSVTFSVFFFFL